MKNSILGKARWLREVALATSKNNGARVAREWLKYAAMFVMLFTIGVGNVRGAIDANSTWTATAFGDLSENATVIILNNFGKAIPNADATSGGPLKVAASYNSTTKVISVSTDGKFLDDIAWTVKKTTNGTKFYVYGSSTKTLGLNGTSSNSAVRVNSGLTYTEFVMGSNGYLLKYYNAARYVGEYVSGSDWRSYNSETASNYKSGGTQQTLTFYVLDAGGGSTPSVTPDPKSLDWGTVLQGSSQENKTISITGANLTEGSLTISATGGYSVTPTSQNVNGTLDATDLTVTPPSTSTTGEKNGKVTISGGGLASNVEIDLSMTVNAASTVTWMNNGSKYTTTLVANGAKPEFPSNPSSCDGTSTTFYGWSTSEWSGKIDDISAKTIYTSAASMPTVSGAITYYAVFCKGGGGSEVLNEEFDNNQTTDASSVFSSSTFSNFSGTVSRAYKSQYGGVKFGTGTYAGYITSKSLDLSKAFTVSIDACKYSSDAGNIEVTVGSTTKTISNSSLDAQGSFKTFVLEFDAATSTSTVKIGTSSKRAYIDNVVITTAGTASQYLTTCCTALGTINGSINLSQLATPDPTKLKASWAMNAVTGIASYTLEVYDSSDNLVKKINNYTSGSEITGLTPCTGYYVKLYTVSSGGEYCDGGLIGTSGSCTTNGYTLTVNKSNVSLNSGSEPTNICGDVSATYAASAGYTLPTSISVTNAGAENTGWTWDSSTGALTINKANVTGNVTVTITGAAQSNFINGETVFIQADSKDYSAWKDDACVKAWFNNNWSGGSAETTYWLFDATDADAGKKLFATVVPASGDLNIVQLQRFAGNCLNKWNDNGSVNKASSNGVNTFRSYGSADNNVAWNGSSTILYLYGSQNSWESSLGTFADQGAGVWTATISNYTPDATSKDYKIKTSYNNGWIGNTGSNNNATLSDMIVGSTYNVTATLNVTTHALTMSKTFVKGTVHFDLQGHGSAIADLTNVAAGSKISAPSPAPNETGWDFGGWYKEAGCTNAWNFVSDEVTETMTLYAKWTEKPKYTITLNAGNGTVSEAGWEKDGDVWKQQQSNGDASITFPSASSNCAGWEFQGWATSAANNVSSDPTSKAAGATLVPASNVTYYAVYRQNSTGGTTYNKITDIGDLTTGTYVIKTSSYAMRNNEDVKWNSTYYRMPESSMSGADASITNSDATLDWTIIKFGSNYAIKSGSKFVGIDRDGILVYDETMHLFTAAYDGTNNRWVFTSTENTSYQLVYNTYFRSLDMQKTAILLYKQGAGLTGNYYTNPTCSDLSITGVADPAAGGSVTLSATSAKSGEKVYAYYTEDPAYRFNSWSVSGTGASISSTTAKFTEITVGSADVTLTANFDARVMYSVTWKANGEELTGVDLGSAPTSVETGEKITNLPPNPSSCDGTSTTFMGWVAESDIWSGKTDDVSGVTIYEKIADFPTVTGNVVYHAVWAKKTGGSGNETLTCSKGTVVDNTMTFRTTNYTIIHKKNDSGATMAAYSPWRVYEKNTVEISGSMTITGLDIVHSETNYGVLQSDKGTLTLANSSGGTTTVRGIDATEVIITNQSRAAQSQWTSIKIYYDNSTYSQYLVKCCNTPTLTFAASPYAVLREDLGGASTTTWAEVDVTFTSNSTGTISAAQYSNATVTNGTAYQLAASKWQVYETTGGTLCGATHAYFEVLTQPSGETPGTGKFHVKTSSGQTGQGTYRIAITQEGTDESHGNYCETTVYGFVDVTLRDKFVDNVNGNGTVTRDGHGAQLATPTLSEFGTQEEDACHSERRKLKGWIKETDLKAQYETGSSTRVQTVDGLCETCADGTDQTSLIVAPGTNVTMSGATWYAVWAYER